MISIQPVPLQAEHPLPPQIRQLTSISADGSVKGKNEGRNRTDVSLPKKACAKWLRVAFKSTKEIPSSTTRPSIWAKTGACEASKGSLRKHMPGITTRTGGLWAIRVRICTGEVWVRSRKRPSDGFRLSELARRSWVSTTPEVRFARRSGTIRRSGMARNSVSCMSIAG